MSEAWRATVKGVEIFVRLTPGSSANKVLGVSDGVLRVAVIAAPTAGEANQALLRLIAKSAKVPFSTLRILRGQSSRTKTVLADTASGKLSDWLAALVELQ